MSSFGASITIQVARRFCVFEPILILFASILLRYGCDRPHDFATPSCVTRRVAMRSRTRSKNSLAEVDIKPIKMH
jgi:hypothetical protein